MSGQISPGQPSAYTWKEILADRMVPEWACEIDLYEGQLELRRLGKLEEKVFAETRNRKSTRLNSSHSRASRMPSSA